jgi:hypothetical protein
MIIDALNKALSFFTIDNIIININNDNVSIPHIFIDTTNKYYSLFSQNLFLDTFLGGSKDGIFCDIAESIDIYESNSYYLEKELNWNGICIGQIPNNYKKIYKKRKCLYFDAYAYDKIDIINSNVKKLTDYINHIKIEREFLFATSLQWFIDTNEYNIVDIIFIDIKKFEFQIIKGIDFEKTHINIICFKHIEESNFILNYLCYKGFNIIIKFGNNFICINRHLKFSWNNKISRCKKII